MYRFKIQSNYTMILTILFAFWALGAYLLTSNEVMKKVRDSHPMNLFSPAKGAAMIFLCLVVFAPAVAFAPFVFLWCWVRDKYYSFRIRLAARKIEKMSKGKSPEVAEMLKTIAESIKQVK